MTLTQFTNSELAPMIIEAFDLVNADHWADPEDMVNLTLRELKSLNAEKAAYEFRMNWFNNGDSAFIYENNQIFVIGVGALDYVRTALNIHDLDQFLTINRNIPIISIAIQLFYQVSELEAEALNDWLSMKDSTGSNFLLDLFVSLRMAAEELNANKEIN